MTKHLIGVVLGALLFGCGGSAADTLRGEPWTVKKWTFTVDDVFDGDGNQKPFKNTSTASVDNAGTLTFTGGEEVGVGGGGQLARNLTKYALRGTTTAEFAGARTDTLGWDPGGFNSEDNMVTTYDGNDIGWNGAWTIEGSGDEVTMTRSHQVDHSATQHQIETHILVLTR